MLLETSHKIFINETWVKYEVYCQIIGENQFSLNFSFLILGYDFFILIEKSSLNNLYIRLCQYVIIHSSMLICQGHEEARVNASWLQVRGRAHQLPIYYRANTEVVIAPYG